MYSVNIKYLNDEMDSYGDVKSYLYDPSGNMTYWILIFSENDVDNLYRVHIKADMVKVFEVIKQDENTGSV